MKSFKKVKIIDATLIKRSDDMPRRRPVMSEELKYEIAKDLGVDDIVKREGWGSVPSRKCGSMVRAAIEKAEGKMAREREQ